MIFSSLNKFNVGLIINLKLILNYQINYLNNLSFYIFRCDFCNICSDELEHNVIELKCITYFFLF